MIDDMLKWLRTFDTCAVSDALDNLDIRGVALGLRALTLDRRVVGRASTVQLAPNDGRTSKRHLCSAAVDSAGPGTVIVVAHNGCVDVAGWGGLLSLGSMRRGVAAAVIDGACRDVDESRELGFPVFALAGVPVTARGRIIETDWNVPVTIRGVPVAPGDYVIADGSGVVFISAAKAEMVLAAAERIAARERAMAAEVRTGKLLAEVMGKTYEAMLSSGAK